MMITIPDRLMFMLTNSHWNVNLSESDLSATIMCWLMHLRAKYNDNEIYK